MVETSSRRRERMRLELNNTRFDIMGLRPAGLLVYKLWWVVSIHMMSRVTFTGRVLALILIAYTSAARHLAIAFSLPLAT
jgi:hypothetical protein